MHASGNMHVHDMSMTCPWHLQHDERSLKNGMTPNRGKMHITEKDTLKIRLDFWHNQPCNIVLHMCVQEYSFRTTNGWKGEAETQRNTRNTIGNTKEHKEHNWKHILFHLLSPPYESQTGPLEVKWCQLTSPSIWLHGNKWLPKSWSAITPISQNEVENWTDLKRPHLKMVHMSGY